MDKHATKFLLDLKLIGSDSSLSRFRSISTREGLQVTVHGATRHHQAPPFPFAPMPTHTAARPPPPRAPGRPPSCSYSCAQTTRRCAPQAPRGARATPRPRPPRSPRARRPPSRAGGGGRGARSRRTRAAAPARAAGRARRTRRARRGGEGGQRGGRGARACRRGGSRPRGRRGSGRLGL